jgi:aminomethyltransferase
MTESAGAASAARRSPLHDLHERAGAVFTEFGGWWMPLRYGSELVEHRAVREAAGLFDLSHMAEFLVRGRACAQFLDHALAGAFDTMPVWKAKYSLVLTDRGGVLDDVIVYRTAPDAFLIVANAGNRDAVRAALADRLAGFAVKAGPAPVITDVTDDMALIAVQGPAARAVLEATTELVDVDRALGELPYYAATAAWFDGEPVIVARTGYTGEDGFEVLVPRGVAPALWLSVLAAGTPLGLVPAGLAARDTLRLEAGMPLHGHELGADVTPYQAGLDRVVALSKDDFVGRDALIGGPHPDAPVLVGLAGTGKRAARAGYAVYSAERPVGRVTSGALSPTLGHPIALAFVEPACAAPGTALSVDVRGSRIPMTVTPLPFYRRNS